MVNYAGKVVIALNVNGDNVEVAVRPSDLLLDVLREQLGLTGAKPGCKNGDCGTCTVMMDGWPVKACLVLAVEAEGHEILTVEGLGELPLSSKLLSMQCLSVRLLHIRPSWSATPCKHIIPLLPKNTLWKNGSSPTSADAQAIRKFVLQFKKCTKRRI